MKLSSIQHLITVVERGSIRAAARHLNVAQPALTRSIQELERELNSVLLERGKKGVNLTPMGKVFLRRATIATGELRRAQDELAQLRGETNGSLTVGLSMVSQITLLAGALKQFRQRYPNVSLSVIDTLFPGVEGALQEGRVDIYVGPVLGDLPAGLAAEQIFEIHRVIFCRKGHPLAESRSLRDLIDAEWMTTSISSKVEEEIGPLFAQNGLPPPRLVMHAHSGLTYMIGLANTDMLMMLPQSWMQLMQWKDMVHMIPIQETLPRRHICIVQRHGLPLTPAAEYFCDMLRREAEHVK